MSDTDQHSVGSKQLSGVQVALGWNRPDFAEKLLNADNAAKDEKALGSLLIHALVRVPSANDDIMKQSEFENIFK